jgi:hypothetical protein
MQSKQPHTQKSEHPETVYTICALSLYALYLVAVGIPIYQQRLLFCDAAVYLRAAHAYLTGGQPYEHTYLLIFMYPPVFLRAVAGLVKYVPLRLLEGVYILLNCCAVLSAPILIAKRYVRIGWLTPAVAIAIFACHPLLTAQVAVLCGNITNLFYGFALAAGIRGLRHNKWSAFYIVIACCAVIKPHLLVLLVVPLFLGQRQVPGCAGTVGFAAVVALLQRVLWPAQYKTFTDTAAYELITQQDSGYGLLRYLMHFHLGHIHPFNATRAAVGYMVLTTCLLAVLWRFRSRHPEVLRSSVGIAAVLVTAVLANPRIMKYDMDIAIVPATVLVVEAVRTLLERRVNPLFIALPVAFFAALIDRNAEASVVVYLFGSVILFLCGFYRDATQVKPAHEAMHQHSFA